MSLLAIRIQAANLMNNILVRLKLCNKLVLEFSGQEFLNLIL